MIDYWFFSNWSEENTKVREDYDNGMGLWRWDEEWDGIYRHKIRE